MFPKFLTKDQLLMPAESQFVFGVRRSPNARTSGEFMYVGLRRPLTFRQAVTIIHSSVSTYLPKDGKPAEEAWNAGRIAALLAKEGGLHDPEFLLPGDTDEGWEDSIYFGLSDPTEAMDAVVTSRPSGFETYGSYAKFFEEAWDREPASFLKLKTVRFKYNGGSNPGKERLVRVNEVKLGTSTVLNMKTGTTMTKSYILGQDLEVEDLTQAFRKYDADKIAGCIEVLN